MFGIKFLKITLFIAGAIGFTTISMMIFFDWIFHEGTSTNTVWIVLIVGLIGGFLLSYFLIKITKLFFMIIGGYLGYTLGIFVYNIAIKYIDGDQTIIYWVTMLICVISCAFLALFVIKHILIISTCICGGYAVIRVLIYIYI